MSETKFCNECHALKPSEAFSSCLTWKRSIYLKAKCKACTSALQSLRDREARKRRREEIQKAYLAGVSIYKLAVQYKTSARGIKIMCKGI